MPVQVIDLRTFVVERLGIYKSYDQTTITTDQLVVANGINLADAESQSPNVTEDSYNSSGEYYTVVGFNKVGDGSVVGP